MNKKIIVFTIVLSLCIAFIAIPRKVILNICIFVGSNWDVPSGESYTVIDRAIERFEKQYPYVDIQYQSGILKEDYSLWLSDLLLQGKEPDVYMVLSEDFNTLSSIGALKPLDALMKRDKSFDASNYYQSSLEAGLFQDKQYALPYESNPQLMFVNQTLLKKEGIELPKDQWTLDEFYDICRKVTKDSNDDGVIDQYGCFNFDWLDSVYSHGAVLFNEKGTECFMSQSRVKKSIAFIQKLNDLNQGHVITANEFDRGQVAFSPMSFAQYKTYKPYPWRVKKYSTFEWDCIKMPTLHKDETRSEVSSLVMGISSRTKHEKEAWQLLKTLTYDKQTQTDLFHYSQGIPSIKIDEDSQIDMHLLNDVMNHAVNYNHFKKYGQALSLADTKIKSIINYDEDLDIALMELQKAINQYLRE